VLFNEILDRDDRLFVTLIAISKTDPWNRSSNPVRVGQAQDRADAERAMVRYQQPPARFSAPRTTKKAAHAWAPYERSRTPPTASKLPQAIRVTPEARRWRYSHGAIRRLLTVRWGAVLSFGAFIGMPPVGCGVGHAVARCGCSTTVFEVAIGRPSPGDDRSMAAQDGGSQGIPWVAGSRREGTCMRG
jgi:hypothetical protein